MFQGRRLCALGILLVAGAAAGCGGKTVKVEGIVTLDGTPVQGATVIFVPQGGEREANGLTDADGVFHLTTFNTGDGAMPGTYKVTVEKHAVPTDLGGTPTPDDPDSMRKAMQDRAKNAQKDPRANKSSLPADYANQKTTPLQFTIPSSGQIKIELKSKGGT
jgi:hypothetical protein